MKWLFFLLTLCLYGYVTCQQVMNQQDPEAEEFWDQLSDKLSYYPHRRCEKGGQFYNVGDTFVDPNNPCRICECCKPGRFRCRMKECTKNHPPPCGKNHWQVVEEGDECCLKCSDECELENDESSNCRNKTCPGPRGAPYYPKNSCCQGCGCYWRTQAVKPGLITKKPTAACEGCECVDGTVTCSNEAPCPAEKLKCVDPQVRESDCTWHCPNGATCYRGGELIMPDETKAIGEKICYCYEAPPGTDYFYPLAFCANIDHWGPLEQRLHQDMCMSRPIDHTMW